MKIFMRRGPALHWTVCLVLLLSGVSWNGSAQQAPSNRPSAASGGMANEKQREPLVGHEDWTAITLAGSELKARPVIAAPGKSEATGNSFVRELYEVQWRSNDPIDLYLIHPKNAAKPPVVLYLYSYPQDTDRFKDDNWCKTVTDGGFAAVGFVSALTGQRYHDRPMKEWFVSELPESLATSTHDVQMILNYLATRDDLDLTRVGMFGQGSGGAVAILASAADPRIRVLDVLEPWGDWPDWLAKSRVVPQPERGNYVTPDFLANVKPLDPLEWLPKVKADRVRIQDVRTDPSNPQAAQERLEAAAPDRAKIRQFGNSHALYPEAAGGKIFDWMKAQLQPEGRAVADNAPRIQFYPAVSDGPPPVPTSSNQ